MLDYYFCQQCQTYHQPNRIINGQILSACECEISTQNATDSSSNVNSREVVNYSHKTDVGTNVHSSIEESPMIKLSYETPGKERIIGGNNNINGNISTSLPTFTQSRYQNMPFMSIINQQNRQKLVQIRNQSPVIHVQPRNTRFISPRSIRQDVVIKKSVSPPTRIIHQSPPRSPGRRTIISPVRTRVRSPARQVIRSPPRSVVSVQTFKPKTMVSMPIQTMAITPIHTMQKIIHTNPALSMPTLLSLQLLEQPPVPPPISINVIPPTRPLSPQIPTNIVSDMNMQNRVKSFPEYNSNRVTLERVSGERNPEPPEISEYRGDAGKRLTLDRVASETGNTVNGGGDVQMPKFLQNLEENGAFFNQKYQSKDRRLSLDRIASSIPNVIGQGLEPDRQCCGKTCYY